MYNKCLSLSVSAILLSRLSFRLLYSLLIVFSLLLHPSLGPLSPAFIVLISFILMFVHLFILSFIPTFFPSLLPSFICAIFPFLLTVTDQPLHWFFILPFPTSRPPPLFPTLRSLSHSLPVYRPPVSSFLHLSFFLHVSWYCRCVPNVPQTLFSTIKLLSLPSPAAARITWAEQALLNIEQRREGGTQGERCRVRAKEREGREEKREERKMRKKEKKKEKRKKE